MFPWRVVYISWREEFKETRVSWHQTLRTKSGALYLWRPWAEQRGCLRTRTSRLFRPFGCRWCSAVERQSLAAEPWYQGSQRYIKPTAATFPRYLGNAIIFFLGRSSGLHCKIPAITFAAYTCVHVVSSSVGIERHPCRPSAYRSLPRGSCTVHFSLLPCSIPHFL